MVIMQIFEVISGKFKVVEIRTRGNYAINGSLNCLIINVGLLFLLA